MWWDEIESTVVSDPTHELAVFCANTEHQSPFPPRRIVETAVAHFQRVLRLAKSRLRISFEPEPVHYPNFPTGVAPGSHYEYQSIGGTNVRKELY